MAYKPVEDEQLIIHTSLRLPVQLVGRMRAAAKRDRRKMADWIRLQLEQICDRLEAEGATDGKHPNQHRA
jgi:hypothetical protein